MPNTLTVTVDQLISNATNHATKIIINGNSYVARPKHYGVPVPYYLWTNLKRFYHAYLVLSGQAMAVQFTEDQYK